ncbi:MAG: TIGR00153 family protein [Planctomycetales bacterium]|nr:TIGR00153 family protein [Planctomycetales bacterium]
MSTIGKLFGSSPFGPLQRHMEQVAKCVAKMVESLQAVESGNWGRVDALSNETSELEHQADQIKDDIRNQLMRRFFMPVHRGQVLDILAIQDNLADTAENVSVLLTIRQFAVPPTVVEDFANFRALNVAAFGLAAGIIEQLDELFETGFGGSEAEKIRKLVHDVAYTEHQADVLQRELLRKVFADEAKLAAADLNMWIQLVKELSNLSNLSENLADQIQMILDTK